MSDIARETSASALSTTKYTTPKVINTEWFAPIIVPPLSDEAHKEMRRGRNPVGTFIKALRRIEMKNAFDNIVARQKFAAMKTAVAWLPSR